MTYLRKLSGQALVVMCVAMAHISSAAAQWFANVTGPDVFGNTEVVAAASSPTSNALVVQCNADDKLVVAFISPASESLMDKISNMGNQLPADLLIKVGQKSVRKFDAIMQVWNNNYIGVVTSGRIPEIVDLIREISGGSGKISVGVVFLGNRETDSFGTSGSTVAMNTIMRSCKLGDIGPTTHKDPEAPNASPQNSKPQ